MVQEEFVWKLLPKKLWTNQASKLHVGRELATIVISWMSVVMENWKCNQDCSIWVLPFSLTVSKPF